MNSKRKKKMQNLALACLYILNFFFLIWGIMSRSYTIVFGLQLVANAFTIGRLFFDLKERKPFAKLAYFLKKYRLIEEIKDQGNFKRSGVGVYILIFIFAMIMFSFLWAIFGYEVFPLYQSFQVTTFPSGVYIPGQLNFMGQMVIWFPLVILWSGGLYLWSNAQNKSGGSDFPGQ